MIASFHLIEYRRRAFVPSARLAGEVAGLRFWRPLNVGGDFDWFRAHPTRGSLYPRLRPDFRRWGFYAVWDQESDVDDFLATSDTGRRWADTATQACHFWLRPRHVRGRWEGMRLLHDSARSTSAVGTVAHLVRLDLTLRGTLAMWGSAAPNLLRHLPDRGELLLGIPLVDRPYVQPVSFSVWRTADSAVDFAYRGDGHRRAVERVRRSQPDLLDRYSAGSFEPYRCQGSWNGRDAAALLESDDRGVSSPLLSGA